MFSYLQYVCGDRAYPQHVFGPKEKFLSWTVWQWWGKIGERIEENFLRGQFSKRFFGPVGRKDGQNNPFRGWGVFCVGGFHTEEKREQSLKESSNSKYKLNYSLRAPHPSTVFASIQCCGSVSFWYGSGSDDYGSASYSGSGSWPNLDKKSEFRNFLASFLKKNFVDFLCQSKNALNPRTFRRN